MKAFDHTGARITTGPLSRDEPLMPPRWLASFKAATGADLHDCAEVHFGPDDKPARIVRK